MPRCFRREEPKMISKTIRANEAPRPYRELTEAEISRITGGIPGGSGSCSQDDCPEGAILITCVDGCAICLHY